mmetsp:Transcript_37854/g.55600  ORF Transcript_37854/g.55600 Transcript_37854/m.55600 type:complete len:272 (-) Transcript_37854:196-1011(-)
MISGWTGCCQIRKPPSAKSVSSPCSEPETLFYRGRPPSATAWRPTSSSEPQVSILPQTSPLCCGQEDSVLPGASCFGKHRRQVATGPAADIPATNDTAKESDLQQLAGVGIVFRDYGTNGLRVSSVVPNGPAMRCGRRLGHGDTLISIDQIDIRNLTPASLGCYILGPAGSSVRLGFLAANGRDGAPYTDEEFLIYHVNVTREHAPSVHCYQLPSPTNRSLLPEKENPNTSPPQGRQYIHTVSPRIHKEATVQQNLSRLASPGSANSSQLM